MIKEKFTRSISWLFVLSLCHYNVGAQHVEDISQEIKNYYLGNISWETRLLDRYLEIESVSITECAIECLRRKRCKSINFSPVMNFCELSYVELDKGRRDKSLTAAAFLQSDVKTWDKGLAGNCAKHKCDINSKCNLVNGFCEVSDCGREQEIENSTPLYYGHHEIGNGVIYGCKENHYMRNINGDAIPTGQASASCNKEGKWDPPYFECYGLPNTCSSSWIPYNGHHYCFVTRVASWTGARDKCLNSNAHLVKLDSKEEFYWITGKIQEGVVGNGEQRFWLGGNDIDDEGEWIWEKDSSPISDVLVQGLWGPGEPNDNTATTNCMELRVKTDSGNLNDFYCNRARRYICKI